MAQTKSTMNLGTLVALPLEMRCCRHAVKTLHAVKTMNSFMYTTDANLKMYEKRPLSG